MSRTVDEQLLKLVADVDIHVSGQEKINAIVDTLGRISSGKDLNRYLKSTEELINDVRFGADRVSNTLGTWRFDVDAAHDFLKSFNSLSAITSIMDSSIEDILDGYDDIKIVVDDVIAELRNQGASLDEAFSDRSFKDAYVALGEISNRSKEAGEALRAMGGASAVKQLTDEIESYKAELEEAREKIAELQSQLEDWEGTDEGLLKDRIKELEGQLDSAGRKQAILYENFLKLNGVTKDMEAFSSITNKSEPIAQYYDKVRSGVLSANEAIIQTRREFQSFFSGDTVSDKDSVLDFLTKIYNEVTRAKDGAEEAGAAIGKAVNYSEVKGIADALSESGTATEEQAKSIERVVEQGASISDITTLVRLLGEESENSDQKVKSLSDAFSAIAKGIEEVGQAGNGSMGAVSILLQSLGRINGIKIGKDIPQKIGDLITKLSQIPDTKNLNNISNLDLSKLNGLKISTGTINAIQRLSEIDFTRLSDAKKISQGAISSMQALGSLDLSKISNVKINKTTVDSISLLLTAVSSIGNAKVNLSSIEALKQLPDIDFEKLNAIAIKQGAINSLAKIGEAASKLKNIGNLDGLQKVDLSNFKNIEVDKEGLKALAEALKGLSKADLSKLLALQTVDLSNFSQWKFDAEGYSAIAAMTTALGEMVKALSAYNKEEEKKSSAKTKEEAEAQSKLNAELKKGYDLKTRLDNSLSKWGDASAGNTAEEYERIKSMSDEIDEYNKKLEAGTISSKDHADAVSRINTEYSKASMIIKEAGEATNKSSKEQEKANSLMTEAASLEAAIEEELKNNRSARTGNTKEYYKDLENQKTALEDLVGGFRSGRVDADKFSSEMGRISKNVDKASKSIKDADGNTKTWVDSLKSAVSSELGRFVGAAALVRKTVSEIKKMIDTTIELDSAMTNLRIVTNETEMAYQKYGETIAATAKEIGVSMKDLIDATTTYARLGYSLDESSVLAKYTGMLQRVGDIDTQAAQDSITSITKAFSDEIDIDNIESVMDRLVTTGNNYPISVSQLAEGMMNASSALSAAGNSFDQSVALLMGANVSLQNASKSSTGLRTIAARLRNTTAELDELGESMESSKYEELVSALTKHNVALRDANGEYRSTYDILKDISAQWDQMTSMEQSALATAVAGTRQQNVFFSVIQNFDEVSASMDSMKDSSGALEGAYAEYMDSIEAHTNSFKAAFENLSQTVINSDTVKSVVDFGTKIIDVITKISELINKLGGLETIAISITGILIANNITTITDKIGVLSNMFSRIGSDVTGFMSIVKGLYSTNLSGWLSENASGMSSFGLMAGKAKSAIGAFGSAVGDLLPTSSAIAVAVAGLGLVISAINAAKKKEAEEIQNKIKVAEAAETEMNSIKDLSDAYANARDAYANGTGSKEEYETATYDIIKALGYEKEAAAKLTEEYGSLDNAIANLSITQMNQKILEMQEGIDAAKADALRKARDDKYFNTVSWRDKNIVENVKVASALGLDTTKNYIEFEVDNKSFDGVKQKYTEMIELRDKMLEKLRTGYIDSKTLYSSDIYQQLTAEIDDLKNEMDKYYSLIDSEFKMAVDSAYSTSLLDSGLPKTEEQLDSLVDKIYEHGTKNGTIVADVSEDADDVKEKIRNILSLKPELDNLFVPKTSGVTGSIMNPIMPDTVASEDVIPSLEQVQKRMSLVEQAEKDMAESGTLSLSTLKSLADANEDYIDCLYREGDAILLNIDKWKEYANLDISNKLDALEEEGKVLEEQRLTIERRITALDAARANMSEEEYSSAIAETTAALETNTAAIEENRRKVDLLSAAYEKAQQISVPQMDRKINELKWTVEKLELERGSIEEAYGAIKRYQETYAEAAALGVDNTRTVFGNIDTNNRQILEWTEQNLNRFRSEIESWGYTIEELGGSISTVLGTSSEYNGVEIAFSPILQTESGPVLLSADAVDKYISTLISQLGDGWHSEDLIRLDTQGLDIDGVHIKNIIADIGETAIKTGEQMHFVGKDGALSKDLKNAADAASGLGYNIGTLSAKYKELSLEIAKNQDLLSMYESIYGAMPDSVVSAADAYADFERIAGIVNDVNDQFETLANLQNKVADSFQMSLNEALEFANVYPEIMDKAQVTADGQIVLNEGVVNSFLEAKQAEVHGSIDAEIRKLEADKATLVAKKALAEAQLDLALQLANGEGQITLEEAQYKVSASNAVAEALIQNGVDEAEAYQLALEAMAGDFTNFDQHALGVARTVLLNMSTAADKTATSYYNAAVSIVNSLDSVAKQSVKTANAITTASYTGSVSVSGPNNNIVDNLVGQTADSYNKRDKFTYEGQKVDLDEFISSLEIDISNYTNAINQIDGQIATLQALRDRPLESYKSSGSSSSGGSGSGGSGSGGSGGSGSTEKETKELFDWIEVKIKRIEEAVARLDKVAGSTYRTWSERNKALRSEIESIGDEILAQNAAYETYMHIADGIELSNSWKKKVQEGAFNIDTVTDEDLKDKIKMYQEYYEKAVAARDAILDLQETESSKYRQLFDNVVTRYEELISTLEHQRKMLEQAIERTETRGYIVSTNYYKALSDIEKKNIKLLEKEKNELVASLTEAVNSGTIKEGSEEWYNMAQQIDGVTEAIDAANTKLIEYSNNIRDINWQVFDLIQERLSYITDEANFLIELMSDDKLVDAAGRLTDQGMATMGLHGMNYNTYMVEASKYAEEIKRLEKEIAKDPYNQDLINRRQELISLHQEAILSAKEEQMAIRDLVEEGINAELDSLKELIDTYNDALDSQKSMYEYQKKVSEQTKTIADLQKQYAAYQGDTSEENRSRLQQIETKLEEAQENLRETEYDKYISDQKEMLDNLYSEYETILNTRLDNVDLLMSDMINMINDNSADIGETISSEAESVGYTLSDAMKTTWDETNGEATKILVMVKDGIVTAITNGTTTLGVALNSVVADVHEMMTVLDKRAKDEIKKATSGSTKSSGGSSSSSKPNSSTSSSGSKDTTTNNKAGSNKEAKKAKTDKENYGVALAIWNGSYGWGAGTTRKERLIAKGFDYATIQAIVNKLGKDGYVQKGTWPGKYYGITSLAPYHYNKFAIGSKRIPYSQMGWTQENGMEAIIRPADGAILTPLAKGDSVLSADATKNLWRFANDPSEFIKEKVMDEAKSMYGTTAVSETYMQNFENITFSMPNVRNYDEMLYQMQRDKNFAALIEAISDKTISPLARTKSVRRRS